MKDRYEYAGILLKALGHPVRLKIVEGLTKDECNVSHIVECLHIPQATVSQHLSILKNAGIIEGERKGTQICYKVINERVKELIKIII
jgi:DNA-binding transcriptional ArsR family regulator